MKTLVFGSNGQLGSEISKRIKSIHINRKKNHNFDISNFNSVKKIIDKHKPKMIINCVAFTNVDKAEMYKKLCKQTNVLFVEMLAKICKINNILLIHFSTDYIFNGRKKGPYNEKSICKPLNYYGKSKLTAEQIIRKIDCKHIILRVSWLYNIRKKNNFIYKLTEQMKKKTIIFLPDDQFGSPTSVRFVTSILLKIISFYKKRNFPHGTYNLATGQPSNRYQIGLYLKKFLKTNNEIQPIKTCKIKSRAKRPLNSTLSTIKLQKILKNNLINWKNDLRRNLG